MTVGGPISQSIFRLGCFLAAGSIVIASAGGHKQEWTPYRKGLFSDTVKYAMFNSVGIIISSFATRSIVPPILFIGATALFCGPAFYKCFTDKSDLQKLMPVGGMLMIASWVTLAVM